MPTPRKRAPRVAKHSLIAFAAPLQFYGCGSGSSRHPARLPCFCGGRAWRAQHTQPSMTEPRAMNPLGLLCAAKASWPGASLQPWHQQAGPLLVTRQRLKTPPHMGALHSRRCRYSPRGAFDALCVAASALGRLLRAVPRTRCVLVSNGSQASPRRVWHLAQLWHGKVLSMPQQRHSNQSGTNENASLHDGPPHVHICV